MKRKFAILGLFPFLLLHFGCSSNTPMDVVEDAHPEIKIGTSQEEVIRLLGEPENKQVLIKDNTPGFGFPSWWDTEVEEGDRVEQWVYPESAGSLEIYFLGDSKNVGHTRFVPRGIVF